MGNAASTLAYFCVGTIFGLGLMAVVLAVAGRRRALEAALSKAYGPLHALLTENAMARAKTAEVEDRLMATYASESAPYSPDEKKKAAEAFLSFEVGVAEQVIGPNRERMRDVVAEWGYLLRDDDYLSLTSELGRASASRLVAEAGLPKGLRDGEPLADREDDVLEQVRETYLELARQRRAGFIASLLQGMKHLFSAE
jgi:hypothetical protein